MVDVLDELVVLANEALILVQFHRRFWLVVHLREVDVV